MDLNLNTTKNFKDGVTKAPRRAPSAPKAKLEEANNELSNPTHDPWEIMVDFEMPRPPQGESVMMAVKINNYEAYLPRGKKIKAPLPVYQVCMRRIKMEQKHQALAEELQGDFKIGER